MTREYRVPSHGNPRASRQQPGEALPTEPRPLPTSHELSDRQRAALYTHEALAVREAVHKSRVVRKRLLVLALHEKVLKDGLALRSEANGTTLHAENKEGVRSDLFDKQQTRRAEVDPFSGESRIEEEEAYKRLVGLSEKELDALAGLLVVEALTGHGQRETPLIRVLRDELEVSVREHWTPDADWLAGYQKAQLAHLIGSLRGQAHGAAALSRKKSELVSDLAALFNQAANAGGFEDKALQERVNGWLPTPTPTDEQAGVDDTDSGSVAA